MKKVRIIPRLDVKGPNVVKGIQLEGLRVVGNPAELARRYYEQGADEILYIDIVASLYNRNNLTHIVEETTEKGVFIPITVGGGIRSIEDITKLLRAGADKVAINTAAVKDPLLLKKAAEIFGSSTIVLSVEAKQVAPGEWEAYTDNGREVTGLDVVDWVRQAQALGVGEILITSVDREGTKKGFDKDLVEAVTAVATVPVIVSGGAGSIENVKDCVHNKKVDGVAIANLLHYKAHTIDEIKTALDRDRHGAINTNYRMQDRPIEQVTGDVSILDYGLGNLRSIRNAFSQLGAGVKVISTPQEVAQSRYLVLPGVGAFGEGMRNLQDKGLDKAIMDFAASGRPLLGICLGMQLLMTKSYEFGEHAGLGIIDGEVLPFEKRPDLFNDGYKVPHVGWSRVFAEKDWSRTIMQFAQNEIDAYFVHSFYVKPVDPRHVLGKTRYFNTEFCSIVRRDNVYGCQFHPEKSGQAGLHILKEILKLNACIKV